MESRHLFFTKRSFALMFQLCFLFFSKEKRISKIKQEWKFLMEFLLYWDEKSKFKRWEDGNWVSLSPKMHFLFNGFFALLLRPFLVRALCSIFYSSFAFQMEMTEFSDDWRFEFQKMHRCLLTDSTFLYATQIGTLWVYLGWVNKTQWK